VVINPILQVKEQKHREAEVKQALDSTRITIPEVSGSLTCAEEIRPPPLPSQDEHADSTKSSASFLTGKLETKIH